MGVFFYYPDVSIDGVVTDKADSMNSIAIRVGLHIGEYLALLVCLS
jgi:hypothetical protein